MKTSMWILWLAQKTRAVICGSKLGQSTSISSTSAVNAATPACPPSPSSAMVTRRLLDDSAADMRATSKARSASVAMSKFGETPTVSCCPMRIRLGLSIPFQIISRSAEAPCSAAISERVSPGCTSTVTTGDTGLELKVSCCPMRIMPGSSIPFEAISSLVETPCSAAISERVSPGWTTIATRSRGCGRGAASNVVNLIWPGADRNTAGSTAC